MCTANICAHYIKSINYMHLFLIGKCDLLEFIENKFASLKRSMRNVFLQLLKICFFFENIWRYKKHQIFSKTGIKYVYQTILSLRFTLIMYISFDWNKQYILPQASNHNMARQSNMRKSCAIFGICTKKSSLRNLVIPVQK
jgi:hypothetical protein